MNSFKVYLEENNLEFDYLVGTNRSDTTNKTVWVPVESNTKTQMYKLQYGTVDSTEWLALDLQYLDPISYTEINLQYNTQPMTKKQFEGWFTIENI